MGLSISYDAFSAPYSAFHRYRKELAERVGIPLELMQGFYQKDSSNLFTLLEYAYPKGDELEMYRIRDIKKMLPLKWDAFKPSPLHELLYHSDCDGHINLSVVRKIVPELKKLLKEDEIDTEFYKRTAQFIEGAEEAIKDRARLEFR